MDILKLVAVALVAAMLSLLIRQHRPEMALHIALVFGILVFVVIASQAQAVIQTLNALFDRQNAQQLDFMSIMLKATGIAFVTEFAASLCRDAGESSIAQKIELGAKVIILAQGLPIIASLFGSLLGLQP